MEPFPEFREQHWAFRLEGTLAATGVLFGRNSWGADFVHGLRERFLEKNIFAKKTQPRWRKVFPTEVAHSAKSSGVFVAMANPNDAPSFRAAVSSTLRISEQGPISVLVAAVPVQTARQEATLQAGEARSPRIYYRSQADKTKERSLPQDRACCMLEMPVVDPYLRLVEVTTSFSRGWHGLADLNAVRALIGHGSCGWMCDATGHGTQRAAAADEAFKTLKTAGVIPQNASSAMVTVRSGAALGTDEFRQIETLVASQLGPATRVLFANDVGGTEASSLGVEVLLME